MFKRILAAVMVLFGFGLAGAKPSGAAHFTSGHSCGEFANAYFRTYGVESGETSEQNVFCPINLNFYNPGYPSTMDLGTVTVHVLDSSTTEGVWCNSYATTYYLKYYGGSVGTGSAATGQSTLIIGNLAGGSQAFLGFGVHCVVPSSSPPSAVLGLHTGNN